MTGVPPPDTLSGARKGEKMTAEEKAEELIGIIRAEKERRGLNYKQLSRETGVSDHSLIHWTNGHFCPGLLPYLKVMEKLGYEIKAVKKPNH